MIEWKRAKTGDYVSKDGRFQIYKHLTRLYNEWELHDNHTGLVYCEPLLRVCKSKAEKINDKKNELQIHGCFYFKTKKNNIDDAMKEVCDALNKAGIEMEDTSHVVLRDNEDGVIYERGW